MATTGGVHPFASRCRCAGRQRSWFGIAERLVLALQLDGAVDFATRIALEDVLQRWRALFRFLDVSDADLVDEPSEDDLDRSIAAASCERLSSGCARGRTIPATAIGTWRGWRCDPLRRTCQGRRLSHAHPQHPHQGFPQAQGPVCIDRIGDGVTVISGDNEEGKSTVLEAIRSVLFTRHRILGDAAERMQPFGQSVRPEISLDFEIGGKRYALRKAFCRRPEAELTWTGGRATGDAAEDKLQELLRFMPPERAQRRPSTRGYGGCSG